MTEYTVVIYGILLAFSLALSACAGAPEAAERLTDIAAESGTQAEESLSTPPVLDPMASVETSGPSGGASEAVLVGTGAEETEKVQSSEMTSEDTTENENVTETVQALPVKESVKLDPTWQYADESCINDGYAMLYYAQTDRKDIVVAVNAGHGTSGGDSVKTWCHPDHTPKVTGGTTEAGATKAVSVSSGMEFNDGTPERTVTLRTARLLRDNLLGKGYDVLMLRDDTDVQLDNVARTVIANNMADCHIAVHWDGDGLNYDKGAYFMSVPDELKDMYPVSDHWKEHEKLGDSLISGLYQTDCRVWGEENLDMDLTQTSYSQIPSVDIELGNQCSDTDDDSLSRIADGLAKGVDFFFGVAEN